MNIKAHWEKVYKKNAPTEVGWYQAHPSRSLEFILKSGIGKEANIIDVGGGASLLVDNLLKQGFRHITVMDIASGAIQHAKARIGDQAGGVGWLEADVLQFQSHQKFDLWHDRAVFHFLTEPEDRRKYIQVLNDALTLEGNLIISTFSLDGPPKCSGLRVMRYSPESLSEEIGANFRLIESVEEAHVTPSGVEQKFIFCRFRKTV
jgi:2-polyprenyl-3-methyl-5-hydroxy-6-metoxy-1,4-benzoquinol methylase